MRRQYRNSLVYAVAALAFVCLFATDASAQAREYVFVGEGVTSSDHFILIPAEKVRAHVPEGYTLATYPSPTGEMAQLFVNANEVAGGSFDGREVGRTRVLHLAVQIEPPAPPPGRSFAAGANHFYELVVVTNNAKLAGVVSSRIGSLMTHEADIDFLYEPPLANGLGLLYGAAPMPLGFFSEAQFGLIVPLDAAAEPVFQGYFWYEGEKGLVISQILSDQFENVRGSASQGTVCGELGSWFSETVASGCADGAGLTWKSDIHKLSFTLHAD